MSATRRRMAAFAAVAAAVLCFLVAAPDAGAQGMTEAQPAPPVPGVHLVAEDAGNGWAVRKWVVDATGEVYDLAGEVALPGTLEALAWRATLARSVATTPAWGGGGGGDGYAMIPRAAARYGAPGIAGCARIIMERESGGGNVPNKQGSGASGPFQFMTTTFDSFKGGAGYPGASVWDYEANVYTALYAMSRGQWQHWGGKPWGC